MDSFIRVVGPNSALEIGGVRMVGMTPENGGKLLVTLAFVTVVLLLGRGLRAASAAVLRGRAGERPRFWTRQGINLLVAGLLLFGLLSIWFDAPTRLTTALAPVRPAGASNTTSRGFDTLVRMPMPSAARRSHISGASVWTFGSGRPSG